MYCVECGARLSSAAKFCNQCGFKVQVQTSRDSAKDRAQPRIPDLDEERDSKVSDYSKEDHERYPNLWGNDTKKKAEKDDPYSHARPALMRDASRPLPPLSEMGFDYEKSKSSLKPSSQRPKRDGQRDDFRSAEAIREEARQVVKNFALWCAGIVLFPIPFYDLVLLMPIQTGMIMSIGRIYKNQDPPEKVLANIAAACGASVFGQITTLVVANVIPIIGKLVSAPFIYGWTYGMGEVAIRYFEAEGKMDRREMKEIFRQVSRDATKAFSKDDLKKQGESLENLREHLTAEEFQKLQSKFVR